jgi:hypothetical protein
VGLSEQSRHLLNRQTVFGVIDEFGDQLAVHCGHPVLDRNLQSAHTSRQFVVVRGVHIQIIPGDQPNTTGYAATNASYERIFRVSLQGLPRTVMKHLREPGDEYFVSAGTWPQTPVWDPSRKPGQNMMIYSPGTGTYRLDEAGIVHLTWKPKYGSEEQHSGPAVVFKPRPKALYWGIGIYISVLALGFFLGFVLSQGAAAGRLGWAVLGLFAALVLMWLLGVVSTATRSIRAGKPTKTR